MTAIIKREFRSHIFTARGVVFLSLFLLATGALTIYYNLLLEAPSISYVAFDLYIFSAILVPILSTSSLSEERAGGRYRLLCSLPIKPWKIILGKFIAFICVMLIPFALLMLLPILLSAYGELATSASYASVAYLFGFSAAYASVGMLFSALFRKKLLTLIFTYCAGVLMFVLESFVLEHLYMLLFGIFDIGVVVYHVSVVIICLLLTSFAFGRESFCCEVRK